MKKQFKKQLLEYIGQQKERKVPSEMLKGLFRRQGYAEHQIQRFFLEFYVRKFFGLGLSLVLAIALFSTLFLYTNTEDTIQAAQNPIVTKSINQQFNGPMDFNWTLPEKESITSLTVSGSLNRESSGKITLVSSNGEYVLFDSSLIDVEPIIVENNSEVPVETNGSNASIVVELVYDRNIASAQEPVALSVASSVIDGNMDQSKLCTIWSVRESVCFGGEECCSFVQIPREDMQWNETIYLTLGKYGADLHNNVSAQIAYVDFNTSEENPYSNTVVSDKVTVPIHFYDATSHFEDVCVESCSLPELADEFYILRIETNSSLFVDHLTYTTSSEQVLNSAPELIMNFTNVSIEQGSSLRYNLSQYFADPENDTLVFSSYNLSNMLLIIENETATISANDTFLGPEFLFFVASDGELAATSNVFSVSVIEKQQKPLQIMGEGLKSLRELIGI